MRRLKKLGCSSDPVSLGCIYLCMVSATHGYLLGADYLNDIQDTETLDDGGIPHKRTTRAEAGEANVDGGALDGDLGHSSGGGRGFVSFSEAPPKFVEARQFGKVLLECAATGTPAPHITWYKDGRPLHKDPKHKKKMHSHHGMPFFRHRKGFKQSQLKIADSLGQIKSKVSLDCVTEEDAGIYECVISNGHEKITAATEVTIASFQQTGCHARNGLQGARDSKPTIHQWSETYMQTIGNDALLVCRAAGPHETYWVAPNEEPVDTKSKKYQMTKEGDLIVRELSFEDMGMFQCLVKNLNGHDMIETFVYPLATS